MGGEYPRGGEGGICGANSYFENNHNIDNMHRHLHTLTHSKFKAVIRKVTILVSFHDWIWTK
jgi:hypothetical protein